MTASLAGAAVHVSGRAHVHSAVSCGAAALFEERRGNTGPCVRGRVGGRLSDGDGDGVEHEERDEEEGRALETHCRDFCGYSGGNVKC